MTLIFGGAYMGKREYAKEHLDVAQIEECTGAMPAFACACVAGLERFSLTCARQKQDAAALLELQRENWRDAVLIARDISCGVVPLDATERAWREENGRMLRMLAQYADRVIRIWYGIPQVLK